MAKTDFKSVDEYLASRPTADRAALEQVRGAIRKAVPTALETISYQIPAYQIDGTQLLFFAGWKTHYSLYPATDGVIKKFSAALSSYEIRQRTIRFPLSVPVPIKLIAEIARFRAKEVAEGAKKNGAARQNRKVTRKATQT